MSRNLKMEVFPSKMAVQATELHVYQLHSQKIDNAFSVIRGAAGRIRNFNNVGVFEDGKYIYTTELVDETIPNSDLRIKSSQILVLLPFPSRTVRPGSQPPSVHSRHLHSAV